MGNALAFMVSFSSLIRSRAKCSDLLSCFLDLNDLEIRLFYTVVSRGESTLDQLSELLSKDRSTVFRNLQKLVALGLVYKEMNSLEKGGRVATFLPNDMESIKEIVSHRIESLKKSMDAFLNEFEQRMEIETYVYGGKGEEVTQKGIKPLHQ